MKGIILAGGNGTRVYPTTMSVSKQLLPVYDKPTIYYPLSTLIKLGIKDILIISNHVPSLQTLLYDGSQIGINIEYQVQNKPRGIAESLIIGEDFLDNKDCALILGDNIFTGITKNLDHKNTIIGYKVNNPEDYGVVEYKNSKILSIEEKPKKPKSNIAVTGLYFYDNTASERAKSLRPSLRGEYEITDVNKSYLKNGYLNLKILDSEHAWFDTGDPDQMFEATMFVKSIQNRTNTVIGSIEYESYLAGNITIDKLLELVYYMPNCKYKNNITKLIEVSSL